MTKKIFFSDKYGLTDAVLNGNKTMTRRLVGKRMTEDDIRAYLKGYTELANKCAYYKIGEVVAVAQSYHNIYNERQIDGSFIKWCNKNGIDYVEEIHKMDELKKEKGYNNKMFVRAALMPHQIRITDIKIERLQDISEEDCLKEGVFQCDKFENHKYYTFDGWKFRNGHKRCSELPRMAFAALLDRVSGKGTWERNPFVFAYSFELVK